MEQGQNRTENPVYETHGAFPLALIWFQGVVFTNKSYLKLEVCLSLHIFPVNFFAGRAGTKNRDKYEVKAGKKRVEQSRLALLQTGTLMAEAGGVLNKIQHVEVHSETAIQHKTLYFKQCCIKSGPLDLFIYLSLTRNLTF